MAKKALVVGINYVGTGHALRGCINDANNITALLKAQNFEVEQVLETAATTAGIKAALGRLTAGAVPGDVLVFHYSGHGSQYPSQSEPDGFEEIICPIDLNWMDLVITDNDLREVFNKVPNGVNVTVILDCCHSGTGLDQTESYVPTRALVHLDETSSPDNSRFLTPPADIAEKLANRELVQWSASRDVNAGAMLIAGCAADQTSADAYIDGTYQGAATAALLKAVAKNPAITYRALMDSMVDYMIANRFSQRPQLDGFSGLREQVFLQPWGTSVADARASVPPTVTPIAPSKPSSSSDMISNIAIIALFIFMLLMFSGVLK
jgi:hypothetical protein